MKWLFQDNDGGTSGISNFDYSFYGNVYTLKNNKDIQDLSH